MIKASSLFYALVISLLIALVCSTLILYVYLTTIQFDSFEMSQRLKLNVDSGINLLLSEQNRIGLDTENTIDLYEDGKDEVFLKRKSWGAFEIIISKAVFKNLTEIKLAQVGDAIDTTSKNYCLYLRDEDKPLAISGKTKLVGSVYVSKAGIKRAYIEGQSFLGTNLVEGEIRTSEKQLPEFNMDIHQKINEYLSKRYLTEMDSVAEVGIELSGDSINNSFLNKTIVFEAANKLVVSNGLYFGNIIITSQKEIEIQNTALIDNVIFIAPKIIIAEKFKGSLQAFATDSVILMKEVRLNYPSTLGLIKSTDSEKVSCIVLMEKDSVFGNIFADAQQDKINSIIGIVLSKESFIYGQVYSNGFSDIQGTIHGSIMTDKLILKTPSASYENHLLNAEIDLSKLSINFVGINLLKNSNRKGVVRWLN